MNIKQVKITDIKPYEKNAKKHPEEQIEYIANSIKEFGYRQPIVLSKDNVIIIGHGRFEASKKLGLKEVPCLYADDLTDDQIKALRLADNKTNESDWDLSLLDLELDTIDLDMGQFGFDDENFEFSVTEKEENEYKEKDEKYTVCPSCGMRFVPIIEE